MASSTIKTIIECNDESKNVTLLDNISAIYKMKRAAKLDIDEEIIESMWKVACENIKEDCNIVISPVLLYLALILLSQMTDNNSRDEILDVLGIKNRNVKTIFDALKIISIMNDEYSNCYVSSAIWFDENVYLKEDNIKKLSQLYDLSAYKGPMGSSEIDESISSWINKNTNNIISDIASIDTDPSGVFELLSTIYFASSWSKKFELEDDINDLFYENNGNNILCKYMNCRYLGWYHYNDKFEFVTKQLESGYTVFFVLPKAGVDFSDVITDFRLKDALFNIENEDCECCDINLFLPKIDISSKINLIESMERLGIKDVFNPQKADFRTIIEMDNVILNKVEQATRINIDHNGIEGAAYVEMRTCIYGGCLPQRKIVFKLDRPYLIIITTSNTPLFAVKVMNLNDSI